jgi:hypothetical protein
MAADPSIVQYIKGQMDAGFRKAQIQDALLRAGWYKEEVDAAFYELVRQSSFAPEPLQPQPSKPPEQKPAEAKKRRSRKKIVLAVILVILAVLAALTFLGFFNILDYLPFNLIAPSGSNEAEGFSNLDVLNWHYGYDGNFSITFSNLAGIPITINSVTAECGGQGNSVVLETLEPTHLETGAGITYSSGDEKCLLREPHESYSVAVTIRYIDEGGAVSSSTGTVSGKIE